jgi:putative flippase GtrA
VSVPASNEDPIGEFTRDARPGWLASLTRDMPAGQFRRYVMVGAGNTVFAFLSYAALTALLTPVIPRGYGYMVANFLSGILNITVSFFGHKLLVFKTPGRFLREWFHYVIVRSGLWGTGLLTLPVLVYVVKHATGQPKWAPYIAGAILLGFNVVANFIGLRTITFRPRAIEPTSTAAVAEQRNIN